MEAWKISIFLFPFCINDLDDLNFAKNMYLVIKSASEEKFRSLLKCDNLLELYQKHMSNSTSDELKYIFRIVSKQASFDEDIKLFFSGINSEKAAIAVNYDYSWLDEKIKVIAVDDITKAKNYYLSFSSNYIELTNKILSTYQNLIFLPNCFNRIKELGQFTNQILIELLRHLFALNKSSLEICSSRKKEDSIKRLLPQLFVTSRAQSEAKEKFLFAYNNETVDARWHSKMFNRGTNQRIYFSCDKNKIIIAHIGGHY